jgi:hypothetical protein
MAEGEVVQHWAPPEYHSIPAVKESPDMGSYIKRSQEWQSEIGRMKADPTRISLTVKPEEMDGWRKDNLPKLLQSNLLGPESARDILLHHKLIPESHDKYEVARPDTIPEQAWSDELVNEYRSIAHKHGIPQAAVNDLMALNAKQFQGFTQKLQTEEGEAKKTIAALAAELNVPNPDDLVAGSERWMERNGFPAEQVKALHDSGFLNRSGLVHMIAKAAFDSGESAGILGGGPVDNVDTELQQFQPGGAKWELFQKGDKATLAERDAIYAKKYPGTVPLS